MKRTQWLQRLRCLIVAAVALLFPTLTVFAQQNVFLPPIGGSGGGEFIALCDAPKYLIGFQLRTADDVDAIRPLCARMYGPTERGEADNFRIYLGGDGGAKREIVCPTDKPVVTGLEIGYEGERTVVVNNIHLFCGLASSHQRPNNQPSAVFDGPTIDGGGSLTPRFHSGGIDKQFCPAGTLALGIQGRSGTWVDAVGLICGEPRFSTNPNGSSTHGISSLGRVQTSNVGSIGRVQVPGTPAIIYAVLKDDAGSLQWFRHNGASVGKFDWQGPRVVNAGWSDFKQIFPGGEGRIYAITSRDTLMLYEHKGYRDGLLKDDPDGWLPAQQIATGLSDVTHAFSGGAGVIYTITSDGTLNWYRHNGGTLEGPRKVGRGWINLQQVLSIGNGIIYAITLDGNVRWFKHNGYLTGAGLETTGSWTGPKEVGRGWGIYKQVFATGNGIFYGIASDGRLMWYRHKGFQDGTMFWDGPQQVGTGWGDLLQVFAQL